MNTVTWESLDVLVQLILYTLAGTSNLVNIFTCTQAEKGSPSIAYEVIQTLSPGHSGARNDKHIGSAGTVSINGYCSDIEEDMEDMPSN